MNAEKCYKLLKCLVSDKQKHFLFLPFYEEKDLCTSYLYFMAIILNMKLLQYTLMNELSFPRPRAKVLLLLVFWFQQKSKF